MLGVTQVMPIIKASSNHLKTSGRWSYLTCRPVAISFHFVATIRKNQIIQNYLHTLICCLHTEQPNSNCRRCCWLSDKKVHLTYLSQDQQGRVSFLQVSQESLARNSLVWHRHEHTWNLKHIYFNFLLVEEGNRENKELQGKNNWRC
jgi:hypothetical protein